MEVTNKAWGWFLAYGILLIILGIFAIGAAAFTTLISVILLGVLLVIGGIVTVVDSFKTHPAGSMVVQLIMGLLYLLAGIVLMVHPLVGAVSLTLVLGVLFVIVGTMRLVGSLSLHTLHWKWSLFNGIVTLVLGILILAQWPASSLIVIGLFVGIDLLLAGWTYTILALAGRPSSSLP